MSAFNEERVLSVRRDPHTCERFEHVLEGRGFHEGTTQRPGDFVIERAFAKQ